MIAAKVGPKRDYKCVKVVGCNKKIKVGSGTRSWVQPSGKVWRVQQKKVGTAAKKIKKGSTSRIAIGLLWLPGLMVSIKITTDNALRAQL
jgi:hypothetical protein